MNHSVNDVRSAPVPLRLLMAEMEIILTSHVQPENLPGWLEATRDRFEAMWPAIHDEIENTRPGLFRWLRARDSSLSPRVDELHSINGRLEGGFGRFRTALESCESALPAGTPARTGVLRHAEALSRKGLRLLQRFRVQDALIARSMTKAVHGERKHAG